MSEPDRPHADHPDDPPAAPGADARPGEGGDRESLSLWQIVSSTVAAAFGVQSSRNRQRDFSHGRPLHFIVAGIAFTVLFVLTLVLVVNLVL